MIGRNLIAASLLLAVATAAQGLELTQDEKSHIDRLNLDRVLESTRHISSGIVSNRSGAGAGSVVAGTEDEKKLAEYVALSFSRIGLDVQKQTFPVRVFEYEEPELRIGSQRFPAVSLYTTPGTYGIRDGKSFRLGNRQNGEVLELILVDVGLGTRNDFELAGDVTGKAVLIQRDDDETDWPSVPLAEAAHRGVAAAIFYGCTSDTPVPEALKQDSVQYQDDIPALSVSRADAERIKKRLDGGAVTVSIRARVDERDGESVNVIGRLKGKERKGKPVIYGAHMDRWFQGAQDNSIGLATMLELARVFAESETPERPILFIAFGAEEAGGKNTLSDWLTGSYAFVKEREELVDSTALYFNLDGGGWSNPTGTLYSSPEGVGFFRQIVADLGLSQRLSVETGLSTWVDAWCLGGIRGTTSAYVQWRRGYLGGHEELRHLDYYHTDFDRFDEKRITNLPKDLRIAALAGFRMSRSEALPYDFTTAAVWLKEGLQADAEQAPSVDFRAVVAAAEKLAETTRELGAELDDSARLSLRKGIYPELVHAGGFLGTLRTSIYSAHLRRLDQAHDALQQGQIAATREALESVLGSSVYLSPEPYKESRRRHFEMTSWNAERGQLPPLGPEAAYQAHRLLEEAPANEEWSEAREKIEQARSVVEARLRGVLTHIEKVLTELTAVIEQAVSSPTP